MRQPGIEPGTRSLEGGFRPSVEPAKGCIVAGVGVAARHASSRSITASNWRNRHLSRHRDSATPAILALLFAGLAVVAGCDRAGNCADACSAIRVVQPGGWSVTRIDSGGRMLSYSEADGCRCEHPTPAVAPSDALDAGSLTGPYFRFSDEFAVEGCGSRVVCIGLAATPTPVAPAVCLASAYAARACGEHGGLRSVDCDGQWIADCVDGDGFILADVVVEPDPTPRATEGP